MGNYVRNFLLGINYGGAGIMKRAIEITILIITLCLILFGLVIPTIQVQAEITASIIIIEPTVGLVTDENGGTATFTVQLDSPPSPNITIEFTSSDPSEGTVSPDKITLNPGNWNKPESNVFTITGIADIEEDGDVPYTITGLVTIGDPLTVPLISVTNLNDPVPIANNDYPEISGFEPIIIPVLDNDTALIDTPIEVSVISDPSFGSYVVNPGADTTITYTPAESFAGIDEFTYMICDANGDCTSALVIIEDQVPPVITEVTPVDIGGYIEVFDEEFPVEVTVTDNFQVDCVSFSRWDAPNDQFVDLGVVCQNPFQIILDAKTLNFGWNEVILRAVDMAGNTSGYSSIWFIRVNKVHIPLVFSP